jgi:hypothetical protein
LAEPRAHLFISLEQARALKEAKFSDKYTDNIHKYLKLRGEIQKYLPNIIDFKARIHKYREDLLEYVNKKIEESLNHLDGLERSIARKADEISEYMASWSIEGSNILLKYEQEGLGGILQEYPQQFIILEHVVKKVIDNMIFIGNDFQNLKPSAYLDEAEDLHQEMISNVDEVEDLNQEIEIRRNSIMESESESENQEISENYHYKLDPARRKLVRVDENNQIEIEYPANLQYTDYSYIKLCELRDRKILIVGVRWTHSPTSSTYRYDLATFECIRLESMKTTRLHFVLFYHDDKIYTFGGQGYIGDGNYKKSSQGEVMEWDGNGWRSLPDMNTAISEPICYAKYYKIFLFGPNSSEYLDLSDNTFHLIGSYGIPSSLKYNIVDDDDYIYFSTDDSITVLNSSFEYQTRIAKTNDKNIKMVKFTNGAVFGASILSNCLNLHDPLSLNYRVLKKIIFRDRDILK